MKKSEFIKTFGDIAVRDYPKRKVLPSLIIAQAILESGWGTSQLSKQVNNYFGLNNYHDSVTDKYPVYTMVAPQEYNGKMVYNTEEFCAFISIEECVACLQDWYDRPKYAHLHNIIDYEEACKFVQRQGYATASNYSKELIRIIKENNLTIYDEIVLNKNTPVSSVYYVQAGAFKNLKGAKTVCEKCSNINVSTLIKYDGTYYRIQAGVFSSIINANNIVAKLGSIGIPSFITSQIAGKEVS